MPREERPRQKPLMKSETTGEIILAYYRELRLRTMDAVSTTTSDTKKNVVTPPANESSSGAPIIDGDIPPENKHSSPIKEKRGKYQSLGRSKYQLFVRIVVAAIAVVIVLALVNYHYYSTTPATTITKPPIATPAPTTKASPVAHVANEYSFTREWGTNGSGDGQFSFPSVIAVDSPGNVYVIDTCCHLQKFDSNGNFITKWGSNGTGNGQFDGPGGVAVDSSGNVYVIDSNNYRIQVFSPTPALITNHSSVSSSGSSPFFLPPSSSSSSQSNNTNSTTAAASASNFLTYQNSSYGISVQHPSNWIGEENHNATSPGRIVKFSSPQGTPPATLNIIGGNRLPLNMSLEQFSAASINNLRQSLPPFNLLESSSTTLGGFPAHKVVYIADVAPGAGVKFMQVWTIKDARYFIITDASLPSDFSNYLPTIQHMPDSFAFIPTTTTTNQFLLYQNFSASFKIKYPSDWRVESVSNSTVVSMFFPQESTASNASNASNVTVDISIENLSASITPDEYQIQIKSF